MKHTHDFRLMLGPDGHGMIYGNFEGYVSRCLCGQYAPDFRAWLRRDYAKRLKAARALVAEADAKP